MRSEPDVDVLIVGGGIHGAGVAQAAAAAGHSVLLLERHALAHGTSGRSSKLIHGGLRYLEQFEFGLVRECLRERTLLLKLAPELVYLDTFHIPIYDDTRRASVQIGAGLALYALLAGFAPGSGFRRLPRQEWSRFPQLRTDGLRAMFAYRDGRTDDVTLTRAVWRSAERLGARLALPAEFLSAELDADGIMAVYRQEGRERSCRARVLVNAAGPWIDRIASRIQPSIPRLPIQLVQGAHIVLAGEPFGHAPLYLEAPQDRRAVFVLPRGEDTLVGTTEQAFDGDPDDVSPSAAEERYLLDVLAHYFPRADGVRVTARFAGLRVLPAGEGRAFERSRETVFVTDRGTKPRMLAIYGGKLTSYRATAEKVMKRLQASLPPRAPRANTKELALEAD